MKRLGVIAVVVLLGACVNEASAQYVPPAGPTLPPELQYFRPQQGVLDNYNQFVAPRYELANQLRTLDQQQRTSFQSLSQRIQRQGEQVRQTQAAATGTAASFMNYSHYYSRGGGGRGRGR
jgi:hypothetical protein